MIITSCFREPLSLIEKSFPLIQMKKTKRSDSLDEFNDDSMPGYNIFLLIVALCFLMMMCTSLTVLLKITVSSFGKDQSSLPSSGHFITTDDLKMEE